MTRKYCFPNIFKPGQIGTMMLKNRIVMPAMDTNFGDAEGFVTEQLKAYYEARARGGAGLIIVEFTCVDAPTGRATPRQLRIDDDKYIPGLKGLAQVIHRHGAKAAIQLHHVGHSTRSAITGTQPVGPSELARPGFDSPRMLNVTEIKEISVKFARAAVRAQQAGFDGVEIHAAHNYLFAQFLSTAWNKRQDAYGGDLKNRARFLIETVRSIRSAVGSGYPVWCRINGVEYAGAEVGVPTEEAQGLARTLQEAGCDAVHVSAWGGRKGPHAFIDRVPMSESGGHLLPLAEAIKKNIEIPVIAVGRIDLEAADRALEEGKADFIAMGRALIADPELPNKASSGNVADIRPCLACNECIEIAIATRGELRCAVNAEAGEEWHYSFKGVSRRKRVAVIGGGPGGMETARVAALRGHVVTLYEKNSRLGGQMLLAAMPPHKERIQCLIDYYLSQIRKLGIEVRPGEIVTPAFLIKEKPDAVVIATGVLPITPNIPGIESDKVITVEEVLSGKVKAGESVAIIGGGMVGCETAEFLAERGRRVTIIELLNAVAGKGVDSVRQKLLSRLSSGSIEIYTGARCLEITSKGLRFTSSDKVERESDCDSVVLAAGYQSDTELYSAVKSKVTGLHLVGDCLKPGNIMQAVADGYRAAHAL